MATAAVFMDFGMPFGEVEESVAYVSMGVKRADRFAILFRIAYKALVISWQFGETLVKQDSLIASLNAVGQRELKTADYLELANRVEHLVELNDSLLSQSNSKLPIWSNYYRKLRIQRDTLESVAESYRWATDDETCTLIGITLEKMYA